jgi:hypothetical protein
MLSFAARRSLLVRSRTPSSGGEAKVEVVETYTSGDLAVLVVIERQHGTIGASRSRTGRCA